MTCFYTLAMQIHMYIHVHVHVYTQGILVPSISLSCMSFRPGCKVYTMNSQLVHVVLFFLVLQGLLSHQSHPIRKSDDMCHHVAIYTSKALAFIPFGPGCPGRPDLPSSPCHIIQSTLQYAHIQRCLHTHNIIQTFCV